MRSMRSVMKKPPTMLLNEAATAIRPSTAESVVSCRPGDDDGGDHGDGVERVGQRHQRRVQQRRDALDHFEPDEARQDEHVEIGEKIRRHYFLLTS